MAAIGLALAGCSTTVAGHSPPPRCAPVFFGVPGSAQGAEHAPPGRRPDGVSRADATAYGTTIGRLKTELTAVAGHRLASASAVRYPAIGVGDFVGIHGLTANLDTSEKKGVTALVTAIRASYRGGCADRPVLLAGYSQGAEVVVRAVQALTARQQAAVSVALLGNPSYEPHVRGDYPGKTTDRGIRPTLSRGHDYALPAGVRARTIDVCAPGDPICGVDRDQWTFIGQIIWVIRHLDVHNDTYAFGDDGFTATAARFLWTHRVG